MAVSKSTMLKIVIPVLTVAIIVTVVVCVLVLVVFNQREGSVKVTFAKVSDSKKQITYTPTYFGMKLIAVYLSEDMSETSHNNIGKTAMIYLNPECDEDISHCDISNANHIVEDYFDLSLTPEEVNQAVNAQRRAVEVGTYRYVRMEFCKGSYGTPNVRFMASPMTGPYEYGVSMCTVDSIRIEFDVADGDEVTVELQYSIDNILTQGGSGNNCSPDGYCLQLPQFVPQVIKS